jgi:hypothetical protein
LRLWSQRWLQLLLQPLQWLLLQRWLEFLRWLLSLPHWPQKPPLWRLQL